jgi:hypothetical protein
VNAKPCPRLWEVEAAHVGRLDGEDCAKQREHQKTCGDCGRMARSLIELKQQLLALAAPADELTLRRLRQSTLQRAAAWRQKRRLRPSVIVLVVLLAAGAAGLGLRSLRGPLVEVTSQVEPSSWSRHHSPHVERVVLREGVFSLSVRRGAGDPRVVVEIPEGEIEDVGTVFSVTVHDGRTTRIAVTRGAVVLRRARLPELKLLAGSVWQAVPRAAPAARKPGVPVAPPPSAAPGPAPGVRDARRVPQPSAASEPARRATVGHRLPPPSAAGSMPVAGAVQPPSAAAIAPPPAAAMTAPSPATSAPRSAAATAPVAGRVAQPPTAASMPASRRSLPPSAALSLPPRAAGSMPASRRSSPPSAAVSVRPSAAAGAVVAHRVPLLSAAAPALLDEDACYLDYMQLIRAQHREAALRVGSDYLERFPHGFRRPDVERALHALR